MLRLSTFFSDVLGTVITGVSTATSAVLATSDSILVALGKLQAQTTTLTSTVANATQGMTSITVAGGTNTPSASLFSSFPIISFTGSLTANAIVIVPNTGVWTMYNGTTGVGYTLQIKTAAGTGVTVARNASMQVFANGTNVLQTVSELYGAPVLGSPTLGAAISTGDNSLRLSTTAFEFNTLQELGQWNLAPGGAATLTSLVTTLPSINLYGALTSNAVVTLPNSGQWNILNSTSGPYTVALKTSAQTVPTFLSQGTSMKVIANGTNAVPVDSDVVNSPLSPANCVGRNLLHNSLFNVQQRGQGPITVAGYLADRWVASTGTAGGSRSIAIAAATDAARAAIGDEACEYTLGYTFTGGSAAGDYDCLTQRLEDLYRYSNKTVTVSFWAIATSGTPKIAVGFTEQFGTGGSPTGNVSPGGAAIQLTTSWARYTSTITLPSIAGKTTGTNNDSCLALNLWLSAGTNQAFVSNNIGVQSGAVSFWGIQLEFGAIATPLEKRALAVEQMFCYRHYYTNYARVDGYGVMAGSVNTDYYFPVQMRAIPTATLPSPSYNNASAMNVAAITAQFMTVSCTAGVAGQAQAQSLATLSAEQ